MQGIVNTILLLLDFDLGRAADPRAANATWPGGARSTFVDIKTSCLPGRKREVPHQKRGAEWTRISAGP
jgi:hypothetical protein